VIFSQCRPALKRLHDSLRVWSLRAALKKQDLWGWYLLLEDIVPDISDQYSGTELNTEYLKVNVRGMHAFQVLTLCKVLGIGLSEISCYNNDLGGLKGDLKIVDIGDSSGTHCLYTKGICDKINYLSINVDANAVEKIKDKGLKAIRCSAETFSRSFPEEEFDIVLLFEVLEHLENPVKVLKQLSLCTDKIVLTVPFVRKKSRVGLHHLRSGRGEASSEDIHLFELCPDDWKLLFQYSGWKVLYEDIYYQYPFFFLKWLWTWNDFEGFYGAVLVKDDNS